MTQGHLRGHLSAALRALGLRQVTQGCDIRSLKIRVSVVRWTRHARPTGRLIAFVCLDSLHESIRRVSSWRILLVGRPLRLSGPQFSMTRLLSHYHPQHFRVTSAETRIVSANDQVEASPPISTDIIRLCRAPSRRHPASPATPTQSLTCSRHELCRQHLQAHRPKPSMTAISSG